jgi:hypothetical protein
MSWGLRTRCLLLRTGSEGTQSWTLLDLTRALPPPPLAHYCFPVPSPPPVIPALLAWLRRARVPRVTCTLVRYNNGGDGPDFKQITDDVAQVSVVSRDVGCCHSRRIRLNQD